MAPTKTKTKATKKTAKTPAMKRPVLVTTSYRGVFFGYSDVQGAPTEVELERARNVLFWPRENHGFVGLTSDGPKQGSRVGPPTAKMALNSVTSVSEVTAEAAEKFEAAPWAQ